MKKAFIIVAMIVSALAFGDAGVTLPEDWSKPEGYAYTLSLTARVLNGESYIETTGSTLAAFDSNGTCRGVAEGKANSSGVFVYRLSIASNSVAESGIKLKVLDSRAGEVYDISDTIAFKANDVLGTAAKPMVLNVKPSTRELTIRLVQNWNWISFNVAQGDRSLDEFLADFVKNATDDDIIKSSGDFATFYDGLWDGDVTLVPGIGYLLLQNAAGSMDFRDADANPAE